MRVKQKHWIGFTHKLCAVSLKRVSFLEQDFLQDELRYEESKAKKK